jgi:hypothetical protein
MRREYEDAWRSLSRGALELVSYFHRVSLAGGDYLKNRFQHKQSEYRPYLLTDAGSTFVLRASGAEASTLIDCWARFGLPLQKEVAVFYGLPVNDPTNWWQRCPYLPENGYGEILVNAAPRYPLAGGE